MIAEKVIFSILALFLFIYIFFLMIRRNDTSYIALLLLQAFGITINFLEIIFETFTSIPSKLVMYIAAIFLPIAVISMEKKQIPFLEIKNRMLAKICLLLKNNKRAKKYLLNIINKYPESYEAHKLLAHIYEKEGGMRKAIDEYVKTVDINKTDYLSYYKIGDLLFQLGQKEEATTILNNLLKSKPDYYDATILLGDILIEGENYKEAINIYTSALKYYPNDYNLYYNLGISYTLLNDFQNAKICYEKAATINHLFYNAYYTLGQINLIYHDIEKAEEYFTKSLGSEEIDAKSYFQLSKIYMMKKEKEKAIIFLNKAIELDRKFYKKSEEEPIFIPIRKYIVLPIQTEKELVIEESQKETKVEKHLEETFKLIESMGVKGITDEPKVKINVEKEKEETKDREKN